MGSKDRNKFLTTFYVIIDTCMWSLWAQDVDHLIRICLHFSGSNEAYAGLMELRLQ